MRRKARILASSQERMNKVLSLNSDDAPRRSQSAPETSNSSDSFLARTCSEPLSHKPLATVATDPSEAEAALAESQKTATDIPKPYSAPRGPPQRPKPLPTADRARILFAVVFGLLSAAAIKYSSFFQTSNVPWLITFVAVDVSLLSLFSKAAKAPTPQMLSSLTPQMPQAVADEVASPHWLNSLQRVSSRFSTVSQVASDAATCAVAHLVVLLL